MLGNLQNDLREWTSRNFPDATSEQQLLGVCEEVGELCHAVLKQKQGIRGTVEELMDKERDAIGDIVIFLANYCNMRGFDLAKCIAFAWEEVKDRDWNKHREEMAREDNNERV